MAGKGRRVTVMAALIVAILIRFASPRYMLLTNTASLTYLAIYDSATRYAREFQIR